MHNIVLCLHYNCILNFSSSQLCHSQRHYRENKSKEVLHARRKHLHARPSRLLLSHIRFVMRSRPSRCLLPFPPLSPYLRHRLVDNHYYSSSFAVYYFLLREWNETSRYSPTLSTAFYSRNRRNIDPLVKEKKLIGENKMKERNHLRERFN